MQSASSALSKLTPKPRRPGLPIATLLALFILAMPAAAQVHRCKDASGKLTYSDRACDKDHSGELIEQKKSPEEIFAERMRASEANERKYRAQAAERQSQAVEPRQNQTRATENQQDAPNRATSRECQAAQRQLDLVASITTLSADAMRQRVNDAEFKVRTLCGSSASSASARQATPPTPVPVPVPVPDIPTPPPGQPNIISNCDPGGCWDINGRRFNSTGAGSFFRDDGKFCTPVGPNIVCN